MIQEYLDTHQTAYLLGVSESTIKRLRKSEAGPTYSRVKRLVRYRITDVRDWMTNNQNRHGRKTDTRYV